MVEAAPFGLAVGGVAMGSSGFLFSGDVRRAKAAAVRAAPPPAPRAANIARVDLDILTAAAEACEAWRGIYISDGRRRVEDAGKDNR